MNASVNECVNFSCSTSNVDLILWFVNGMHIDLVEGVQDLEEVCDVNGSFAVFKWEFRIDHMQDISELNNSNITCQSLCNSEVYSSPAVLKIQGLR